MSSTKTIRDVYWVGVSLPAELFFIFRHLKLELLTQFPASNDEKYFEKQTSKFDYLMK